MRGTMRTWRSGGRRCAVPALIGALFATFGLATFATLPIASSAWADCVPSSASAVSGQTVTCTGTAPTGFQASGAVNNLTVNVVSGATVLDSGAVAIGVNDNNTVTNNGTVTAGAGAAGIAGGDGNTVINNTSITVGDGGVGVFANSNGIIANNGIITLMSNSAGIITGLGGTVTNKGTITGGDNTVAIFVLGPSNTIVNIGTITVGAATFGPGTSTGIDASNPGGGSNMIANNGRITVGAGGIGIATGESNFITNNGTIVVGADGVSVGTCGCFPSDNNTVVNNGTLDGTIALLGSGNTFTNAGLITITDPGTAVGASHEIDGTFTQTATGVLALRVNAAGVSDALFALNISLAGALRAVVQPGLYGMTTVYNGVVVACSCNGLNGTKFDTVASSSPFFTASATYDYAGVSAPVFDPNVSLTLTRIPFGSVPGETRNQQAVGNYLESNYSTNLTGPAATFFSALLAGPSVAPLDQLSGEGSAGTQESAFMAANLFMAALENQGAAWLAGGPANPNGAAAPMQYAAAAPEHPAFKALRLAGEAPRRWSVWGAGFGGDQSLHGDPVIGSADLSHRTAGGAAGVNYQADPDLLLGLAVGGSASNFSVPDRMTNGHLDGAHLGAFAVSRRGSLYASGTAGYGWFDNSTTRSIVGVGASETATGRFASNQLGGRLEVGWRQPVDRLTVVPFAAVQFLRLWQQGYMETSIASTGTPGVLGLTFQPHAVSSLPTFLGAQIETRFENHNAMAWVPYGRVSWVHEFEPTRDITASLSLLPAGGFTVDGARAASDSARVETGSNLYLSRMISLFGNFTGEFSNRGAIYAGNGGLRVNW